jgi:hypothetical protein
MTVMAISASETAAPISVSSLSAERSPLPRPFLASAPEWKNSIQGIMTAPMLAAKEESVSGIQVGLDGVQPLPQ